MSKFVRLAGVLSVLSLTTVFAVASLAVASTVELIADSDSTLRRGYNNLNEGANKELFVMRDGPKRAIVSFDIGVLDPASQVVDAQMFLTVADDAVKWEDGRPVDLHRLLVSFTEGNGRKFGEPNAVKDRGTGPGVTWSCSEDTEIGNTRTDCVLDWEGGWVYAVATPTATIIHTNDLAPGDVLQWDVTLDVQAAMSEGAGLAGWVVRKREEGRIGKVEYYSKDGAAEAGDMTLAPTLVITFSGDQDADGDGYTVGQGDCDDANPNIYPGAVEVCDGADNNCDGAVDEGVTVAFYLDTDGDGYGVAADPVFACSLPAGYAVQAGDCDDTAVDVNPGAVEGCNAVDDNCDTAVDEGFDSDGDGYSICGGDCDDAVASVNPGAAEVCDGIDNNCDGTADPGCLTGLAVNPASFTLTTFSSTAQLSVTGTWFDGTTSDLTGSSDGTTYSISDPAVASVGPNGLVTAIDTGTATISAFNSGLSAVASVNVQLLPADYVPQPEGSFGSVYEELAPVDIGIDSYDERRFSIITGLVQGRGGGSIAGVTVSIHSHPEYGSVQTDVEGRFSIPVNGTEVLTVVYEKAGLLTVQRKVDVPWNDIAVAETVTMIQRDPVTTQMMFTGSPGDVTVHQSSETVDGSGSRSATMVFEGDNRAYTFDELGNQVFHSIIDVRATEYDTEESMPGLLPPTSAFTYCVELEADGLADLHFEKPVTVYVDNFLGFDVGEIAPVGYYNLATAQWEAIQNGVVVRLLDTDLDGIVDALDATGDDIADDLNSNGNFADEVTGLSDPGQYYPGDTYWRFKVTHFTPYDVNWPWYLGGAVDPFLDIGPSTDDPGVKVGSCPLPTNSYVEQRSRVYHEDIPIPGTGMTLHYASDRVEDGRKQLINVPASGDTIPQYLNRILVKVTIAGRVFDYEFDALPNQKAVIEWDGLDYLGRPVKGARTAYVKVGWVFTNMYQSPAGVRRSFAMPGSVPTGIFARGETTRWRQWNIPVTSGFVGSVAEGWTLSPHHQVDLASPSTLYKGNGTTLSTSNLIMEIIAGTGTHYDARIPGPAIDASIERPVAVHADKDRNIYIGSGSDKIFKIDNDGYITHFAGGGQPPDGVGDGGPATSAIIDQIRDIGSDHLGNIYVIDGYVVRRISPDGIITRYAGGGPTANGSADGLLATEVWLDPQGITFDAQGSLYIADNYHDRIFKVDPNGYILTVAGRGYPGIPYTVGYSGDGGPATSAMINNPFGVAVDREGNIYFSDTWNYRVRKVSTDGIITTVAGNGQHVYQAPFPGEGLQATDVPVEARGVHVDGSGNLYFIGDRAHPGTHHILKVTPSGALYTVAGAGGGSNMGDGGPAYYAGLPSQTNFGIDDAGNLYVSSYYVGVVSRIAASHTFAGSFDAGSFRFPEEGGVGHVIDPDGLHERTVDLSTGLDLITFGYDSDQNLASISDRFGNETTIQRDADGKPTSITSPDGIVTGLTIDANNHLKLVSYPDGTSYSMDYTTGGLLTGKDDPAGNHDETRYDSLGRVSDVLDLEGGHWIFDRVGQEDGSAVASIITAEGNLTSFEDREGADGEFTSLITGPDGSQSTYRLSVDGLFAEKQDSCGMDLEFAYDMDHIYGYRTDKGSTISVPSGLSISTSWDRSYEDTNYDEVNDRITDTVTVNGKVSTVVNDVLTGTVTATSPTGRQVASYYSPATLLTSRTSTPGLLDTDFTYDTRGRLETVTVGSRTTTFAYDTFGYLDYMTTPDSRTFDYTYDIMGRLTDESRPDGGQVTYSYDGNGNVTAILNPNDITHGFTYTATDQRESYNTPISGSYIYQYDRDRRLQSVIYPSGQSITNTWATGQLQSTSTPEGDISYGYDCGGKLGSVSKGAESASYTYDGSLLLTDTRSGTVNALIDYTYNSDLQVDSIGYAGAYESFVYDDDGLLTGTGSYTITRNAANGLPEAVSDGTVTQGRSFSGYGEVDGVDYTVGASAPYSWSVVRDNAGRITQKVENIGVDTVAWDYTYDQMGRLETVYKDNNLAEAYSYDPQGNRLSETNTLRGVSRSYTHSVEDHTLTAGADSYTYDVDGFLTTRTISSGAYSGTATFDYSSRGELLSASLPSGDTITYQHDPMGRRLSKSLNGVVVEKYLWQDATTLLAVYDASDNLLQRFEYADGRMPVSMVYNGAVYYLAYDQVGSLKVVTDAVGTVAKRVDYDSFGNILSDSNPGFVVPFGFAGGLHDRDTGLVRFGARDYDPATGKWTAKDPIDFAGGDLNLYGYTLGDPVGDVDPSGLAIEQVWRPLSGGLWPLQYHTAIRINGRVFGFQKGLGVVEENPNDYGGWGTHSKMLEHSDYFDQEAMNFIGEAISGDNADYTKESYFLPDKILTGKSCINFVDCFKSQVFNQKVCQ